MSISEAQVNDLLSAPLNARDENGDAPIHRAAVLDHEETVHILLLKGADKDILDGSGRSALIIAAEGGCLRAMNALLAAGADVGFRYSDGMYSALDCAAVEGDLNALTMIIQHGASVDAADADGRTALNCAASSDEAGAIDVLVEAGADVDSKDRFGLTSLHAACYNGASRAAVALLRHEADKETEGFDGRTPLHLAAENGHLEVAKSLLAAGTDVDRRNCNNRYSALDFAAARGHINVLRLLLAQRGASVNAADSNGRTALHNAAFYNHSDAIDLLVGVGAIVEACDVDGWTPLHHASYNGAAEATTALLNHGANKNKLDGMRRTPLHMTTRYNCLNTMKNLLAWGADATLRDGDNNDEESALDVAAIEGHVDIVKELIVRRMFMIDSTDSKGKTALHHAARSNQAGAIDVLVWAGANHRAQDGNGHTPLHSASLAKGSSAAIDALLRHGADKDAVDILGRPPLHLAVECGNFTAVECLLAAGADVSLRCGDDEDSVLDLAANEGRLDVLREVIRHGVELDDANTIGLTTLHRAASSNQAAAIDLLIWAGADMEAEDNDGCTPLHNAACTEESSTAVFTLIRRGANKDARDSQGRTPLHLAAEGNNFDAVQSLLARGADITLRDGDEGDSALDFAASGGHIKILRTIIKHGADVNAVNGLGATALHRAACSNHAGAISVLVGAGADLEARMIEHQFTPLLFACQELCAEALETLLTCGANVDVLDADGDNSLHCVAREAGKEGATEMVALLLRHGVDEAAFNDDGCIPADVVSFDHEDGDRCGEAILRLLTLLACAPGNRAWERRRLLVMCRAHQSRIRIGPGTQLGGIAARVVSLAEEGLFRKIVGFM